MTTPCQQGERFVTLEMILKSVSDTLAEQKQLGAKTYEKLADISEQGAQIKSLTERMGEAERDIQVAFKSIRRIDLLHAKECGEEAVNEKRKKFWDGVKTQITPYAISGLLFILWLVDKLDVVQAIAKLWKEMKG
jgi:uncharacterized coiled-coil protein SlyX